MKVQKVVFILILLSSGLAKAQNKGVYDRQISWSAKSLQLTEKRSVRIQIFEGASMVPSARGFLPVFIERFPLQGAGFSASVTVLASEDATEQSDIHMADVTDQPKLEQQVIYISKNPYALIRIMPLIKENGRLKRITSFRIQLTEQAGAAGSFKMAAANSWAPSSVLASGQWYRIAIPATGLYVMDKAFLTNMGINVANIDPRNIRIYGKGGAMLPQENAIAIDDDLIENAIEISGESDGRFDAGDKIFFYAKGPESWTYTPGDQKFHHQKNVYSTHGYYFLNLGSGPGKRVSLQPSLPGSPQQVVNSFDAYFAHEEDKTSFIKSGREWYGEIFDKTTTMNFSLSFPGLITSEQVYFGHEVVARSFVNSSMSVSANGNPFLFDNFDAVHDDYTDIYVDTPVPSFKNISVNSGNIDLTYSYNKPTLNSAAWLNYFELNFRRELDLNVPQMMFRDSRSLGSSNTRFNLISSSQPTVWDVSDIYNIKRMDLQQNGNVYSYQANTQQLKEYLAFKGNSFSVPSSGVKVSSSQNLHALGATDYVIISHPAFISEAKRLASFHSTAHNLRCVVVTPEQVFNEFSSGAPDIGAIRNFMRMLYERAANPQDAPKYLLLFGDASYDFRNIRGQNANFVLTYESRNSYAPTGSYCSDDFFGHLDPAEGEWPENFSSAEGLDIGIGRFPVKTLGEASIAVNKVLTYYSPQTLREWRNEMAFVGDDEDNNIHMQQSDWLTEIVDTSYRNYNINKIFLDAYKQVSTPGGGRYPDVKTAINNEMNKGCLLINYTGHGGELGWAHEKILDANDVRSWTNSKALPLFITATCEFSKYDDPDRTSAGELVFLRPDGGGIALFTTVRLVFSGPNFNINRDVLYKNMFEPVNNRMPTLGEIFTKGKNKTQDYNSRNFVLLGDPALTLAYPQHKVVTTSINGNPVSATPDTIRALSKVSVSGLVQDKNNQTLTGFNGTLYVSVYDKKQNYATLVNDIESGPYTFNMQKNVIYRGLASVVNGVFSFSFIVPKDISYINGPGKISYYAQNGLEDAAGSYGNVVIGGTSDSVALDNAGPDIRLYMNDLKFVNGGNTNMAPLFIAMLHDENGINTVGNGIGREIMAVLDGNISTSIVMNDYYLANLNSYSDGKVNYNFKSLTPGRHNIKLKAWDVYNNSSEAALDFVVAEDGKMALGHVLNYPNPFTTNTTFHFDHNKSGLALQVQIQVFTISGKLLKTLNADMPSADSHFDDISWDGRDDYGDRIGKGVYIYKVRVRSSDGEKADKFEKLVILN